MDNVIKALVTDLSTWPQQELVTLAKFHRIQPILNLIAEKNLRYFHHKAQMLPKTYTSKQIPQVVNYLNNQLNANICLRHGLIIRTYTNRPGEYWFDTF